MKAKLRNINMLIIVIIGFALIGLIATGVLYTKENSKQDDLASQIDGRRPILSALQKSASNKDPEQELAQAKERLAKAQQMIPAKLTSNDIYQKVFQYAEDNKVEIQGTLNIPPEKTQTIAKQEYTVVAFSMTIKGTYSHIMDFINTLENNEEIPSFAVSNASFAGSGGAWQASFNVAVISQASTGD